MENQIPLNDVRSGLSDQNTAYQPSPENATAYSKIGDDPSNVELGEMATTSPGRNPYKWSLVRKGLVLLVVLWCTTIGDFGSRISGAFKSSVENQFHASQSTVDHTLDASQLMVGVGGVIAVALSIWLGRLPVLFWFMIAAFATAIGAAAATSFGGFAAARIFNGLFSSAAQGTGLLFISDMFESKKAQAVAINLWGFVSVLSPYIGPFFAGFMTTSEWRIPFWMYTGVTGIILLGVMILGRETWYHPRLSVPRSKPLELIGIQQLRSRHLRPSLGQAIGRASKTITKPAIVLVNAYYLVIMAWIVPMSSVLLQPMMYFEQSFDEGDPGKFEQMDPNSNKYFGPGSQGSSFYNFGSGGQLGAFFLAPGLTLVLSLVISYLLHRRIDKKHLKADRDAPPETRLWVIWIGQPFIILGLLLFGVFVQRNSHYMLVALAWAMYVFGTLIITVGVTAYQAEAFPQAAGEAGAWISFAREFGSYILTFVASEFAKGPGQEQGKGAARSFGAAAGISAMVCPIIILLQLSGERFRHKGSDLDFDN